MFAPSAEGMWFGDTKEYELREQVGRDSTQRIIRWQGPDRTVTERDVRAVLAIWSEGAAPQVQSHLAEYGRTHPRSDEFPAYERLLVDLTGRLWVQDFVKDHLDNGVRRWLIISADGTQFLGRLTHPASINLKDIGDDWILAVQKDDLEVESIVIYTIVREAGPAAVGNNAS